MSKIYTGESPLVHLVSFDKLLRQYEEQLDSGDQILVERAKYVLEAQKPYPILREGFDDLSILEKHKDVIKIILTDTFSPVLTKNEIKTASIPFGDFVFNSSERFQKILQDAGEGFELEIDNLPDEMYYFMYATVILNFYYGYPLDYRRPLFYNIPDSKGIMRHYRILYNADFMDIEPITEPKKLAPNDVSELLDNLDDIERWKEKIPPNSFKSKGFVVLNMFDVTAEYSISEIKSSLINTDKAREEDYFEAFQDTFRSLFNLKDIEVGFAGYDAKANQFLKVIAKNLKSFVLRDSESASCNDILCTYSYGKLLKESEYYAIGDVERFYERSGGGQPYKNLYEQGIRSAILAPIALDGVLLGVLEVVSTIPNQLNSINAVKLADVMPFIVSAVVRGMKEEENLIDAIIQKECTTIHPSVYWKFQEQAIKFLKDEVFGEQPSFEEVVFKDIYPLYGQIDIKESSKERNLSIQRDLMIQLSEIKGILTEAHKRLKLPIYEELTFRVDNHMEEIKDTLFSDSEQGIFDFVQEEINPVLHHLKREGKSLANRIKTYEGQIDESTESYYDHRRNYDESVMEINRELAILLDKRQEEAQEMFPHYFERYKTDGVEHNMYIGAEIANGKKFEPLYLNNLRLWQLQTMVEMENRHYVIKPQLPVPLDVASLLLVYSTPLAIRFRMDEKRFDVDGTYNARYEIIKKRIDKSYIKGTNERLTQKGKLSIVYSQKKDEREYLRYIKFLKSKGYFTNSIEVVELEGLQGVTGLKAIRAEILYRTDEQSEKTYTYDDLMEALKV